MCELCVSASLMSSNMFLLRVFLNNSCEGKFHSVAWILKGNLLVATRQTIKHLWCYL